MTSFDSCLNKLVQGHVLTEKEMASCITFLMQGNATEEQTATFLTRLSQRGETPEEIAGAARALRSMATTITAPAGAIDCCGTGGDGAHTYNISTAVALVAAACGVKIAKHGNRSASSKSGAADVLEKLGVDLALSREQLEQSLNDIGFCFLMAPNHHQAMKHVAAVRKKLGHRTIFNLLGPLANPAGTTKQLIGVYDRKWVMPVAEALKSLGTEKALVVHGEDGLDEITLTGNTIAAFLEDGIITEKILTPATFGLPEITADSIKGGDANTNAAALLNLLQGEKSAYRDIVLANTAAVLFLHDGRDFKTGVQSAAEAIDNGQALNILERYRSIKS